MRIAIVVDTEQSEATAYEVIDGKAGQVRTLEICEEIGTFPMPGPVLAAIVGINPASPIDVSSRPIDHRPADPAYL